MNAIKPYSTNHMMITHIRLMAWWLSKVGPRNGHESHGSQNKLMALVAEPEITDPLQVRANSLKL